MDSTVGALIGLLVSIFLIIKKVSPAYSLILGALIGGLAGGFSLEEVVVSMTEGVKDVSSAVLRILTAGGIVGCSDKNRGCNDYFKCDNQVLG